MFGNQPTGALGGGSGLFGAPQQQQSAFGSAFGLGSQQQSNAGGGGGGGLFGGTSGGQNASAPSSFGFGTALNTGMSQSLGQQPQAQSAFGLQPQQPQMQSAFGGLFGTGGMNNNNALQQQQQQPQFGGGFTGQQTLGGQGTTGGMFGMGGGFGTQMPGFGANQLNAQGQSQMMNNQQRQQVAAPQQMTQADMDNLARANGVIVDPAPGQVLGASMCSAPVTLTVRPSVHDFAALHPQVALTLQDLYGWFADNEALMTKIKAAFADVSKVSDGAFTNTNWKGSDANLMSEQLEQADDLLDYVEPSVTRLAKITETLTNDFVRLESGLVAVPPVEHALLIQEFQFKANYLERQLEAAREKIHRVEMKESEDEKINHFRTALNSEKECIDKLTLFLSHAEAAIKSI